MIILSFQGHCQAPLTLKPNTKSFCTNHRNSVNPSNQWRRQEGCKHLSVPIFGGFNLDSLKYLCALMQSWTLGCSWHSTPWMAEVDELFSYPRHVLHEYWEGPFRWISQEAIILNNSFMQQIFQQLNLTLKCIYFLKGQNRTD